MKLRVRRFRVRCPLTFSGDSVFGEGTVINISDRGWRVKSRNTRVPQEAHLTLRVRLCRGDELHELAHVANTALVDLDQAFGEIRAHGAHSRAAVSRAVEALRAQPGANPEYLADWEGALKESEQLQAVLQRFRFAERL